MDKKRKHKGGAEKERDKKQKLLQAESMKCHKITNLFSNQLSSTPEQEYNKSVKLSATSQKVKVFEDSNDHLKMSEFISLANNEPMDTVVVIEDAGGHLKTPEWIDLDYNEPVDRINHIQVLDQNHENEAIPALHYNSELEFPNPSIYFKRPNREDLTLFFKYHPKQVTTDQVLKKTFSRKDGTNRQWLSYDPTQNALFCITCLAFSKSTETNPFIDGMADRRHIHQRIEEHEKCLLHRNSSQAYFLRLNDIDMPNLIFRNQMSLRRDQIRKTRNILERIVDVIKLLGKRGLNYRGNKMEAAYTLNDKCVDHSNFLEIILLLSKYDPCLQEHVNSCTKESKKLQASGGKGRGNLVTFLSKNTINTIIDVIRHLIQEKIAKEVNQAKIYSIQIDTTQDITSKDQCSIVVRYVSNTIQEKLLAVVLCENSSGEGLHQLLLHVLKNSEIRIASCIGNSTDGAANMQGKYKGLSAQLLNENSKQVHVWCYAHVLNLVLADTTKSVIPSSSLFELLNDVAVFFKESHLRMTVWENLNKDSHHKRPNTIGETRWWSKSVALTKIFGAHDNQQSALYVEIIETLNYIESDVKFKSDTRIKAKGYKDNFLKYETILTSQMFIQIFNYTTPLSNYLQTRGFDILKAYEMICSTKSALQQLKQDFVGVKRCADNFIAWAEMKLEDIEPYVEIQSALPVKRIRKKKIMPGELAQDEVFANAEKAYEVNVFNVVLDTVIGSMQNRFQADKNFFADLSCLDPKKFVEIKRTRLRPPIFDTLSENLLAIDPEATADTLRNELNNLALCCTLFSFSALLELFRL